MGAFNSWWSTFSAHSGFSRGSAVASKRRRPFTFFRFRRSNAPFFFCKSSNPRAFAEVLILCHRLGPADGFALAGS
jgi:hypothetical protein